jgi:hypothetical protein
MMTRMPSAFAMRLRRARPKRFARRLAFLSAFVAALSLAVEAQAPSYSRFFASDTMRVDFLHTGGPGGEALAIDQVVRDGPWPGSRTRLLDDTNLGESFFEVADRVTGRILYSRGFGSIYGEWITTAEFHTANRTFQESLRFPWPKAPVRLRLKRRDAQNELQPFWSVDVDPARTSAKPPAKAPGRVWTVFESGPADRKVDLLLISDGYTGAQLAKFHTDAARLVNALFSYEPFKSRKSAFNVRALDLASEVSSVNTEHDIFGLPRYMLTFDNRALRAAAASAPYDVLEILVNSPQYGGGGIFNLQSTVAVDHERAEYVFVHELAHNLAGLADEYVGNVTYQPLPPVKPEPWEPNLTALHDPALLKWRDLVEPSTPVPTPESYAGKVGAFEGGGYEARGLFRPEIECIMGSARTGVTFCRVCQQAILRVVSLLTDR